MLAQHPTPKAALETLLDLAPLQIHVEVKAKAVARLKSQIRTFIRRSDKCTLLLTPLGWKTTVVIPGKKIQETSAHLVHRGSRTEKGNRAEAYGVASRVEKSFVLASHATMFQVEIFAILECVSENHTRIYK